MDTREKKRRLRKKIQAKSDRPRLTVFKSARHIYAQIIEPGTGKVLASASDLDLKRKPTARGKKTKNLVIANKIGQSIGKQAIEGKIEAVVFDRSPYRYHGRIKALAEGAREKGLKF